MSIFDTFAQKIAQNLPFIPNNSQKTLLGMLSGFILDVSPSSRDSLFVLRGYAGTGKTSIIGALVKTMTELKMPVVLMAPTGRAAKVFSLMSSHAALTIHKSIYRQQKFSVAMTDFELIDNRRSNTLFLCDEASMISTLNEGSPFGSGNLLSDLIEYVYGTSGCKLLLIGDDAQLPPVGQPCSPALDVSYLKGFGLDVSDFQLTEVARQKSDSAILANATMLRHALQSGDVSVLPHIIYKECKDVRRVSGYDLVECLEQSYHHQGLDDTIIITRSNLRANQFNMAVRNQLLDREEELSSGDRLLVVKNNYYWGKDFEDVPFIANGDVVVVDRVYSVDHFYGFRFARAQVTLPDYEVSAEMILLLDTLQSEGPNLPLSAQQQLFERIAEDYPEIRNQRDLVKAIKENPYFNALQVKYAYAVTCHKSQGGQWSDVYLDLAYINPDHLGIDFYRWLYTAFTRARQTIYLVNPSDDILEK